jgi:hypothetical protein
MCSPSAPNKKERHRESNASTMATFGCFFENYRSSTNNWAASSTVKVACRFSQKMDWAAFWATFSQTHLVTLVSTKVTKSRIEKLAETKMA